MYGLSMADAFASKEKGCLKCLVLMFLSAVTVCQKNSWDIVIRGEIGKTVMLPCIHKAVPKERQGNVMIYWQTEDDDVVHEFSKGKEGLQYLGEAYKNRTIIFTDQLEKGNFSVQIAPVRHTDANVYICYFNDARSSMLNPCTVKLEVTASFTDPSINLGPCWKTGEQVERNVSCISNGGYPKPQVHWSIQNGETLVHPQGETNFTQDPDSGLYIVDSQVTVNFTEGLTISCSIENQKTGENKTSSLRGCLTAVPPGSPVGILVGAACIIVLVMTGFFVWIVVSIKRNQRNEQQNTALNEVTGNRDTNQLNAVSEDQQSSHRVVIQELGEKGNEEGLPLNKTENNQVESVTLSTQVYMFPS
ncbi:CD276 antigen homolog [Polyodon spathula]|uniref:CD276 antigen homolog n=1 Tax=Polyodon spathula TaxID=7913 RepID=UPI001B7EC808|nr:CD276 antigen homolog [Polyodon spathula]XP_041128610.1 CD276 antigen homolog [Polyodon spathula]XP_041128611.1 CD276 antigen homolog [Polyodon spathula]XP_041128612.1 CD276 antigen homolog [Polyodon spathula]XP_041128613.1 CD276 antigen homolog [Polyodon spathula]XP_041128614.1 CD276 antigen homolog [Polyodon spathula]